MRLGIIDTTRVYSVVPAGEVWDGAKGYCIVESCPVKGIYIFDMIYDTVNECNEFLNDFLSFDCEKVC